VEDSIEELEEEKENFEIESVGIKLTVKMKKNNEFSLPLFSLQNT